MLIKRKNKISDLQLISLYKETGQSLYLGELFTRYSSFALAVCMKYLQNTQNSEDAVMDIFEKLTLSLKTQNINNFKPWLYSVAKNHCLMLIRSSKPEHKHRENYKTEEEYFVENENNLHQANEEQLNNAVIIKKAIELLKEDQKKCIELFYFEDKSYAEIVENTGFDIKKVKSCLQNGKRNLKLVIEKQQKNG